MTLRALNILAIAGLVGRVFLGLVIVRLLFPVLVGNFAGVADFAKTLFTGHPVWAALLVIGGLGVYFNQDHSLLEPEGRPYLAGLWCAACIGAFGLFMGSRLTVAGGILLFVGAVFLWLHRKDALKREQRIGSTVSPVIVYENEARIRAVLGGRHPV